MLYPFDNQHQTSKRVLYLTYDVTAYLKKGENVVGVILGNGWYNQKERNIEGKMHYGIQVMIFQMNIEYTDGTSKKIVSDKTWKTSSGPIIFNNIYYGETYDARLEKKGWNSTGYDDNKWGTVYSPIFTKLFNITPFSFLFAFIYSCAIFFVTTFLVSIFSSFFISPPCFEEIFSYRFIFGTMIRFPVDLLWHNAIY